MNKKHFITTFLIVFAGQLFGQQIYIKDEVSSKPIMYAHVIYLQEGNIIGGVYSDENGIAYIQNPKNVDSVVISCMGYSTKKIAIHQIGSTIFMDKEVNLLQEITINMLNDFSAPTVFLGLQKENPHQSFRAQRGFQMVTLIENPYAKNKEIKSIIFPIKKSKTDKSAKLKIIFFENKNKHPGQQIDVEFVIDLKSIKGRMVVVNLDSVTLFLPPQGLFMGIEWMGCINSSKQQSNLNSEQECDLAILINMKKDTVILNQVYYRDIFNSNQWWDEGRYNNTTEFDLPVFGLTVYE